MNNIIVNKLKMSLEKIMKNLAISSRSFTPRRLRNGKVREFENNDKEKQLQVELPNNSLDDSYVLTSAVSIQTDIDDKIEYKNDDGGEDEDNGVRDGDENGGDEDGDDDGDEGGDEDDGEDSGDEGDYYVVDEHIQDITTQIRDDDNQTAQDEQPLKIIPSKANKPKLVHEGYLYTIESQNPDTNVIIWRCEKTCARKKEDRCYGKARTVGFKGVVDVYKPHLSTHRPNVAKIEAKEVEQEIIKKAREPANSMLSRRLVKHVQSKKNLSNEAVIYLPSHRALAQRIMKVRREQNSAIDMTVTIDGRQFLVLCNLIY